MNKDEEELGIQEIKLKMIREEFLTGINTINKINPSVTFYGSARIGEGEPYYEEVKKLSFRIAQELNYAILSGGGPGIMEAANRGAFEAGGRSVGLTIKLPHEQSNNPYITDQIPFNFFFARQSAMSYSTEVCIFCPGGFGTLAELFEILTLQQTGKIGIFPLILYGSSFWEPLNEIIKKILLDKYKTIDEKDLDLYIIEDDPEKILEIIKNCQPRDGRDALI